MIFLACGVCWGQGTELKEISAGYTLQYFEDCGVEGRQPHVQGNMRHTFSLGSVTAGEKERTVAHGAPNFDAVFDGLDAHAPYVLAVTYASEKGNKRIQRLLAGKQTVHGPLVLPDGHAERFLFKVPADAMENGILTLHFTCDEGHNAVASVIELWAPLPARNELHLDLTPNITGKLEGMISGIAYEGFEGAEVSIRTVQGGIISTMQTNAEGRFEVDVAKEAVPGKTGSFHVSARYQQEEVMAEVPVDALYFVEPRIRPMPHKVPVVKETQRVLDGVWRIHPEPAEDFFTQSTASAGWANFTVPGQWLQQGFDIPRDKPVGIATEFTVPESWQGQRIVLRFDAVHGGATYWLNGQPLGSSENLFTPVEFDITDVVKLGANNHLALAIKVDTPSELASYSSNYAFHNLGGIDRSVRVFVLPPVHVSDLFWDTPLDAHYQDAELRLNLSLANTAKEAVSGLSLEATVEGPLTSKKEAAEATWALEEIIPGDTTLTKTLPVKNPLKWSDEKPNLYRLRVALKQGKKTLEVLERNIGFRTVEIKAGQLYVNGCRVKLAGACRHEIDPLTGRAATACHGQEDVRLFKSANFNYIRTSHYPPTQEFLDACDAVGLYVECEAPFCWARGGRGEDDPALGRQFLTPTAAMLRTHRHHPSIILWSIANESGSGPDGPNALPKNFAMTMDYCRTHDPSRPAMFNNEWSRDGGQGDIAITHYPPWPPETAEFLKGDPRPILLDEYFPPQTFTFPETLRRNPGLDVVNWSSGQNTPDSFWSKMFRSNRIIGGAIWAGIDEEFFLPGDKTAGYGAWGFIDVWRRQKSLWWDAKRVFSPIWIPVRQVQWIPDMETVQIPVENRYSFTDLNELDIRWELGMKSGKCKASAPPLSIGAMEIPLPKSAKEGDLLVLRFFNSKKELITANGITLGTPVLPEVPKPDAGCPEFSENGPNITVTGKGFSFEIHRDTLAVQSSTVALQQWPALFVTRMEEKNVFNPNGVAYAEFPDESTRKINRVFATPAGQALLIKVEDEYADFAGATELLIDKEGQCRVTFTYTYTGGKFTVGELGLRLVMPEKCQEIDWRRKTEWDVYPEDHLGRPEGHAAAAAPSVQGPRTQRPSWPWHLDANEYGTRDFLATKYTIYRACLKGSDGIGLEVNSDGTTDVRAAVMPGGVHFHVLQSLPQKEGILPWPLGTPPRTLAPGDTVSGTFSIRLMH